MQLVVSIQDDLYGNGNNQVRWRTHRSPAIVTISVNLALQTRPLLTCQIAGGWHVPQYVGPPAMILKSCQELYRPRLLNLKDVINPPPNLFWRNHTVHSGPPNLFVLCSTICLTCSTSTFYDQNVYSRLLYFVAVCAAPSNQFGNHHNHTLIPYH